jgi:hypothetical protein
MSFGLNIKTVFNMTKEDNIKTTEKDILLICKGWFDHGKYKDVLEALKDYQATYTGSNREDITDKNVLDFRLFTVAETYFKSYDWSEMLKDRLYKDIFWQHELKVDYNYLCWLLITQIHNLQVKKDNSEWIIDLSAYDEIVII